MSVRVVRSPAVRRGSVYLLVLGVSLIVTTIGLSALCIARVDRRAVGMTENTLRADVAAQSLLDLALYSLINDPAWRTAYPNDTWMVWGALSGFIGSVKLVDEMDGDLTNDANQPVRLCARAVVGDAVRIYSVQVEPRAVTNLLSNPGFESGTSPWTTYYCDLARYTDTPHSGTGYLRAYNRFYWGSGPAQPITGAIENGVSYYCEAWVMMASSSSYVILELETTGSTSGTQYFTNGSAAVGTSWTKVATTIIPSWSGTLTDARFNVYTSSGTTSLRLDDTLVRRSDNCPLVDVPGTYRREVLAPPPAD